MQTLPFTIGALHDAYAKGLRPADLVTEVFRRIRAVDDPGMFLHLFDEDALRIAAEALGPFDPEKPLWGIPFAIKDNIDAAGAPTTAACPAFTYTADADAFVVAHLRAAGALLIGKTNLDQFATGLVGMRSPYQPPKNALDPAIVPGGSSSGSAVAVAHGLVSFSLGTDTAGSGRVPAALNNIVGLKPTLGALSASGMVPACRTLDTISIFALTVDDAYRAFRVAAVYDAADAYCRPVPAPPLTAVPPKFRVGIPNAETIEFLGDRAQEASFRETIGILASMGAELVELDFKPFYAVAEMLYDGAWVAERFTVVETLMRDRPEALHPVTRQIVSAAESLSAADAFRGIYRLEELKRKAEPLLGAVDLLCVPTIPTFFTVADLEADPITPNSQFGTYTNFVNLLDLCGIAVPVAPRSDKRPGGVTLLAAAGRDGALAALAAQLEQTGERRLGATDWPVPALPETGAAATDTEIEIAVCGAHMSGLPLNGQLTDLGGRFLRRAETAPDYRFYALAGGPPFRPGLVKRPDAAGASIELEIWALPSAAFGRFLQGIPAPLAIGTIHLNDGVSVKGFLCESAGTAGAEDITALKGWRAFLQRGAL